MSGCYQLLGRAGRSALRLNCAQQLKVDCMGAKTCLVAQSEGDARGILAGYPAPDEAATARLVTSLFPDTCFGEPRPSALWDTYVSEKSVVAGCFPGLSIVVAGEVAVDRPSELSSRFVTKKGTTVLHAMHSVVDWFAFAVWRDGRLVRSLSVAPDNGVIENIGEPLAFEKPYWGGQHPAVDPDEEPGGYPLPFHPLELGEEALREFFGFQIEGFHDGTLLEPDRISMLRFNEDASNAAAAQGKGSWWKFW